MRGTRRLVARAVQTHVQTRPCDRPRTGPFILPYLVAPLFHRQLEVYRAQRSAQEGAVDARNLRSVWTVNWGSKCAGVAGRVSPWRSAGSTKSAARLRQKFARERRSKRSNSVTDNVPYQSLAAPPHDRFPGCLRQRLSRVTTALRTSNASHRIRTRWAQFCASLRGSFHRPHGTRAAWFLDWIFHRRHPSAPAIQRLAVPGLTAGPPGFPAAPAHIVE